MVRALVMAAALIAQPAWAQDAAMLNGVPVIALQTYADFSGGMVAAGWRSAGEVECGNAESSACHSVWLSPSGQILDIQVDYRNDANEFYVRPAVAVH